MKKISVTVPEAIALTGIGRTTLYRLIAEGKLSTRKLGTRTLILLIELEQLVQGLPVGGNGLGSVTASPEASPERRP